MAIQRWSPFRSMERYEDMMDRLWRGFFSPSLFHDSPESWHIPLDIVEEGDNVVIHASLPGVNPDDIEVTIDKDVLTIKGETKSESDIQEGSYLRRERRSGSFYRALQLPENVDREKVQPRYANGVLTITVPKQETAKPRRLSVTVGDGTDAAGGESKAA